MSIISKAANSGIWFVGFRVITQAFSWIVTILVARVLLPEDYGLMALASIITGYVEVFSEMGLGAAIVQRENITQNDLSSNFWFSLMIGSGLALATFGLALPTAWLTNEPRVVPLTQWISILFVVGAVMIVPFNLLMRNLRFKMIGFIQLASVLLSSGFMIWMAYHHFGAMTLLAGVIIQRLITVILVFWFIKWTPSFHFKFNEVRPFLSFGVHIAGSKSLFYLFQKSDTLIVGKVLGSQSLGFYNMATQLASIPTDKIISILNQVSFPVFSRFQNDHFQIEQMFLKMTKYISVFVIPLYLSGAVFGEDIIYAVLGEKWANSVFLFRVFCVSQVFVSLSSYCNVIHNSMERPHWVLYFQLINIIFMPVSIYIASLYGLRMLFIPWLVLYPLISVVWIWVTIRKLDISFAKYSMTVIGPALAAILMIFAVKMILFLMSRFVFSISDYRAILFHEMFIGLFLYIAYLIYFERKILIEIWNIRKN